MIRRQRQKNLSAGLSNMVVNRKSLSASFHLFDARSGLCYSHSVWTVITPDLRFPEPVPDFLLNRFSLLATPILMVIEILLYRWQKGDLLQNS